MLHFYPTCQPPLPVEFGSGEHVTAKVRVALIVAQLR